MQPPRARSGAGAAALVVLLVLSACSGTGGTDSAGTDTAGADSAGADSAAPDPRGRDEILAELDDDNDGVVERAAYDFELLVDAPERVVATVVAPSAGQEIAVGDVLTSLVELPPTLMGDPANPDAEEFTARLQSMVRLRLVAASLTDLGFEVDVTGTDSQISDSVIAARERGFEEFAREQAVRDDPTLVKRASPHCLTLIATTTESDTLAAAERIRAGEDAGDVAREVNFEDSTQGEGGDLGCRPAAEWAVLLGPTGVAIAAVAEGELSDPLGIDLEASPTGRLFVSAYVAEVKLDEADVAGLASFTGVAYADGLLRTQMSTYDVTVADELGVWRMETLSIAPGATAS